MGAEALVLALIVIAGALLVLRLRRARVGGEAAEPPAFARGVYLGCTFLIILFAAFAWGSIVLGWIVNPQPDGRVPATFTALAGWLALTALTFDMRDL